MQKTEKLSSIKDSRSENLRDCFGGRNSKGSIHLISKYLEVFGKNARYQKNALDIFACWLLQNIFCMFATLLNYFKHNISKTF